MEDIEILRQGSRVIFRRPGRGLFGIVDESRLTRPAGNSIFRIMLYMAIPFCDEHTDQMEGTTVVHIVNSQPRPPPNLDRMMFDLVTAGLPTKLAAYHVVQAYEEGKNECLDYLGYQETKVAKFHAKNPNLIVADSSHGTWSKLQSMGFQKEHLPRCVGGTFDYNHFTEWTRARISVEDIMSSAPLMSNRLAVVPNSRVDAPIRRNRGTGGDTQGEVRERNAIKSRRSYHRRKLQEFSLREHLRVWEMRNDPIRKENAFLEGVLAQAQEIVKTHTGAAHVFEH